MNRVHIQPTDEVLDVVCGYGNTAITARHRGAKVTGLDLTPKFLLMAKEEKNIVGLMGIKWEEGDLEYLSFENESFDAVVSTFGHIFAPNQHTVGKEMFRVQKKGRSVRIFKLAI